MERLMLRQGWGIREPETLLERLIFLLCLPALIAAALMIAVMWAFCVLIAIAMLVVGWVLERTGIPSLISRIMFWLYCKDGWLAEIATILFVSILWTIPCGTIIGIIVLVLE